MPHKAADRIRNVALIGHRGSGKTSLHEAMLYEAGAVNRLGKVADGSTVSDHEEDEHEREMSIGATLASFEHGDRKINLIDTPGDPSFVADAVSSLRVADAAVVVVNAVMGVEVHTERLWTRADDEGLARLVFVNMLDRERADFFRVLNAVREQLSDRCVAIQLPIGAEHELTGIVDLLHNCAYLDPAGAREG
ncbi:MAG TPA: GTP-binding protein, partial [Solirubrobacterales bacterium]|nr:GTP-binding protein [Solirubrobacterales bacterium]